MSNLSDFCCGCACGGSRNVCCQCRDRKVEPLTAKALHYAGKMNWGFDDTYIDPKAPGGIHDPNTHKALIYSILALTRAIREAKK